MTPLHATCLCGTVAWEVTAPLEMMHHCHCSRCRKAHGTGFATFAMCAASGVRVTRGRDEIATYESSPGGPRAFCRRCGSVAPSDAVWNGQVGIPVGPLEGNPGERPMAHIFVASKAPWVEIAGDLPRFEAYPPGVDAAVQPDLARSGGAGGPPRGSCLCGAVAFVVTGEPLRCQHCHCMRCRRARGAAHASNFFTALDGVHFTAGEDRLRAYKLPEARFFGQVFCTTCGSPMPRLDRERGIAIVPMGSLDGDLGFRPTRHIFAGSKAPWFEIADDLPQFVEMAPTV